jgi:magnesium transporter
MTMIRSLAAPAHCNENPDFVLRRNLPQDRLEVAYAEGDLLWIDVVDPSGDEIDWIGRFFNFSPSVMEDLYRADRRPTLLAYPAYVFLSLFEPQIAQHKVEGREIHCVIGERYLITVRSSAAKSIDAAYDRAAKDNTLWARGLEYFLYLSCQYTIDSYYPLLDRMSNQLNHLEEEVIGVREGKATRDPRQMVYYIKQQLIHLRGMIAPQREVLSNLLGETRLDDEEIRDLFRHLYERLLRVYDLIDAQRDLSSDVLDIMENQQTRRMVDAVNRLTIFSMIFLPLTFLASLFELDFITTAEPFELPVSGSVLSMVVVGMMLISAGSMYWMFRRRGWL